MTAHSKVQAEYGDALAEQVHGGFLSIPAAAAVAMAVDHAWDAGLAVPFMQPPAAGREAVAALQSLIPLVFL